MKNYYSDPRKEEIYRREITKRVLPQKEKRRKWIGHSQNVYWAADLIDFSNIGNYNHQKKYILIVMDVYSRFVWGEATKNKSSTDLKAAFDKIFDQSRNPVTNEIEYPNFIAFDQESGILSSEMRNYFSSKNIQVYSPMGKHKVSLVERFIRTFKEDLSYYFTNHRYVWQNVYKDIINTYNKKKHSTLYKKKEHLTPEKVQAREDDYTEKVVPAHMNKKDKTAQFQVGDHVRFKINKGHYKLAKKSLKNNWSEDIYEIVEIDKSTMPIGYRIRAINPKVKTVHDVKNWRNNEEDLSKYKPYVQEHNEASKRLFYHHELMRSKL